ncbi:MAG: YigZ family protein [Eubacteriales bacterium]
MNINLPENYMSLAHLGVGEELVTNKSKFIGYAKSAMTEEDAIAFLDEIREQHPLASCICYAYVCGYQSQVQKYHDGHEPVGGKPILSAIKLKGLIGTTCAVVRYYGGIKLGVGGLARAFGNAAISAIENGEPSLYELGKDIIITYDYNFDGKISYLLENSNLIVNEKSYSEKVEIEIQIKNKFLDEFLSKLNGITNSSHTFDVLEEKYIC